MELTYVMNKYLNNEKVSDAALDDALLKLAINQSLQTLLYPVFGLKEYKKYYISWVMKQEQFYALQEEITSLFNENSIKHIYFKGSILSKLYDDPSVRTRGDIDLYVIQSDFERGKAILLSHGYQIDDVTEDCSHHVGLKKMGIEVELHFNMFDMDCSREWISLFKNPFQLSYQVKDFLYAFSDTYHFIYCMLHFAHHLRHGAGLRYMMDFHYMLKKTKIDFNLLHEKNKILKTEVLYGNIINALRVISGTDFDPTVDNEDVKFFLDYMASYGIHGFSDNESSLNATHDHKFRYAMNRIFLMDKNYRLSRHPRLGKHWYTYPICLIVHFWYLLTHKVGAFFRFLFGKNKNKALYKKLGV